MKWVTFDISKEDEVEAMAVYIYHLTRLGAAYAIDQSTIYVRVEVTGY